MNLDPTFILSNLILSIIITLVVYLALRLTIFKKDWSYYAYKAHAKYPIIDKYYSWYKDIYPNMDDETVYFHVLQEIRETYDNYKKSTTLKPEDYLSNQEEKELRGAIELLEKAFLAA